MCALTFTYLIFIFDWWELILTCIQLNLVYYSLNTIYLIWILIHLIQCADISITLLLIRCVLTLMSLIFIRCELTLTCLCVQQTSWLSSLPIGPWTSCVALVLWEEKVIKSEQEKISNLSTVKWASVLVLYIRNVVPKKNGLSPWVETNNQMFGLTLYSGFYRQIAL